MTDRRLPWLVDNLLGVLAGLLSLSTCCQGECPTLSVTPQDVGGALLALDGPPLSWTTAPAGTEGLEFADVCTTWEGLACVSGPANCTSLDSVALSGADLSGTLPAEWSAIASLRHISLSGNSFSGSLPPEWSTLTQLEELDLSTNLLTGTVPLEWSALEAVSSLYLANNTALTGKFPQLWILTSALYNSLNELPNPIWFDKSIPAIALDLSSGILCVLCREVTTGTSITVRELSPDAATCYYEYQGYRSDAEPMDLLTQCVKCASTSYAWYLICEPGDTFFVAYMALGIILVAELVATLTGVKSPASIRRWQVHGAHRWNLALRLVLLLTALYNVLCVIPVFDDMLMRQLSAQALAIKAFGNTILAFGFIVVWWSWQMVAMIVLKLRRWSWLGKLSEDLDTSEIRHARDWTLAASQDVFLETAAAVQEQQTKLMGMALVGISAATLAVVIKQMMGAWVDLSNTGLPLEGSSTQLNIINFILFGYSMMVTILLPENLFTNSAVRLAICWHGNLHLKRLTSFHWITAATLPLGVMCFIPIDDTASLIGLAIAIVPVALLLVASVSQLSPKHRGPVPRAVFLWREILTTILPLSVLNIGLVLIIIYSIINSYSPGYIPAALCVTFQLYMLLWLDAGSRIRAIGRFVLHLKDHLTAAWQLLRGPHKPQSVLSLLKQLRPTVGNSGVSQRRRLLLLVMLFLQSMPQVGSTVIVVTWVATAGAAVVLIFSTDREVHVNCIIKAPGFGLLVDAFDLRGALETALSDQPSPSPLHRLRRYKATLFRMRETLAVSYRWQDKVTPVGLSSPGNIVARINQSRWQMSEMLGALKDTKLRYVWLDVLSVPQPPMDECLTGLQRTLLSRMMAVYASARVTLVLRSVEAPRGRYHQRAWTFQEYVASKSLVMCDEMPLSDQPPDSEDAPPCATCQSEQDAAKSMREMVQRSMHICCPFWIVSLASSLPWSHSGDGKDNGSYASTGCNTRHIERSASSFIQPLSADKLAHVPDLTNRMRCFLELAPRLNCMEEADRVRALIPVLMNSPVERHEKLVELVLLLEQRFPGEDMSRFLKIITAAGGADSAPEQDQDGDQGQGPGEATPASVGTVASATSSSGGGEDTALSRDHSKTSEMFTRSVVESVLSESMLRGESLQDGTKVRTGSIELEEEAA